MAFRSRLSRAMRFSASIGALTLTFFITSCSDGIVQQSDTPGSVSPKNNSSTIAAVLATEGFETGSKGSYTAADVVLGTGTWNMNEALIGNLSSDRKSGSNSARIRNSGKLTMKFNVNSAGTVTVKHAKYGTDASTTWELWYSTNSGSTWTKSGSTITASSTTLQTATFTLNQSSSTRLEIRKTDGTTNRLNIDDIVINDYGTSGGGGSSTLGEHLTLGNPSGAVANTSYTTNYLMEKTQYALSYHKDNGTANWVSWHLDNTWLGSTPRQDDFRADGTLPTGWYRVADGDYTGSGFDRGHMTPSADRTSSVSTNSSTFLMTNIIPQSPDNNQGPWARLEDYARTLVSAGNEVYIISGGYGTGGTGSNGTFNTIAGGKVKVPNKTWKVLVVLSNGSNDASRVTTSTRVIGVLMPNSQGIRTVNWGTYRVSVDYLESLTGYNFLSEVSSTVQASVESVVDNGPTQ